MNRWMKGEREGRKGVRTDGRIEARTESRIRPDRGLDMQTDGWIKELMD